MNGAFNVEEYDTQSAVRMEPSRNKSKNDDGGTQHGAEHSYTRQVDVTGHGLHQFMLIDLLRNVVVVGCVLALLLQISEDQMRYRANKQNQGAWDVSNSPFESKIVGINRRRFGDHFGCVPANESMLQFVHRASI